MRGRPAKKGERPGGRQKGTPNKATTDVRQGIAMIAQGCIGKVQLWLDEIEDPAKRLDLFLKMIEYHIPKLSRSELTAKDGEPLPVPATIIIRTS